MISSEVQRTLVKSPPELWAELSDPASLARHLGELGEIKITRTEPEKTVEWEATDTTGKVLLKPSGWGTKVTLTVIREVDAPEQSIEPEPAACDAPEPEPIAEEAVPAIEPEAVTVEPVAEESIVAPEPRQGFFARLFRRRSKDQALLQPPVEPEPAVAPEPDAAPIEPEPTSVNDAPPKDAPPENLPDISAELKAAEEVAAEQVTSVLTAVLDRLGAAHHRPFSRA